MKKRLIIGLVTGCLSLLFVPGNQVVPVAAEEQTDSIITNDILETDEWRYVYEGTDEAPEVTIVEYVGADAENPETLNVEVPYVMDGYPVTRIAERAFYQSIVETVIIPCTVKDIGDEAFLGSESLTSVTIVYGEQIEEDGGEYMLGARAFSGCENLVTVEIPQQITRICEHAFANCYKLENVELPEKLTQIDTAAFIRCSSITEAILPDSIQEIQNLAYDHCTSLQTVVLPSQITSISSSLFSGCTELRAIVIPEGVTTIEREAFFDCTNLKVAVIPNTVVDIYTINPFNCCEDLTIYAEKDSYAMLFADDINNNVTGVPVKHATSMISETPAGFVYMHNEDEAEIVGYVGELADIEIPSEIEGYPVTNIAGRVFKGMEITSVVIPSSVTSIGDDAFNGCEKLEEVQMSECLTYLGDSAFCGCTSLTGISIPATITYVGNYAFDGCSIFESIEFEEKTENTGEVAIGYCAFRNCDLKSIAFPVGVKDIWEKTCYNNENLASLTLPEGITWIGDSAFDSCSSLTEVTLPSTLIYISDNAFKYCSGLTEIVIPENVTTIERLAFASCTELKKATILSNVEDIASNAFSYCDALTIYTTAGSAAHTYATENDIPVVLIGGSGSTEDSGDNGSTEDSGNTGSTEDSGNTGSTEDSGSTGNTGGTGDSNQSGNTGGTGDSNQSGNTGGTGDSNQSGNTGGTGNSNQTGNTGGTGVNNQTGNNAGNDTVKPVEIPTVGKLKGVKVTAKKKSLVIKWKKLAKSNGYEIQISTKKNYKGAKIKSIKKTKTSYTAKKLKAKKKYYVRVRAYRTYKDENGKTQRVYGKWTKLNKKTK